MDQSLCLHDLYIRLPCMCIGTRAVRDQHMVYVAFPEQDVMLLLRERELAAFSRHAVAPGYSYH